MPDEPEQQPPPGAALPPASSLSFDFSDVLTVLASLGAVPHDPITPAEAAEELDDREADDEDSSPRDRTWAEYDAYIEANRRFDLDVVEKASTILATHARPIDNESSGDVAWRLCKAPQGFEDRVGVFLDGVAGMGMDALGRLKDHA